MEDAFITSRKGCVTKITLYKYAFEEILREDKDKKLKFLSWLDKGSNVEIFSVEIDYFIVFFPLEDKINKQYKLITTVTIAPPFSNTQLISSYINKLTKIVLSKYYKQFLNYNCFIYDRLAISPFLILKAFNYNIEVFENGEFFIHLITTSKIISDQKFSVSYMNNLILACKSPLADLQLSLVEGGYYKRKRFTLFDETDKKYVIEFLKKFPDCIATFDYHFLASYSPNIFGSINKETTKDLNVSINVLISISKNISFPDNIILEPKPFKRIEIENLSGRNNLIVGEKFLTNKQSAAFHKGIYAPIYNQVIQPVVIDSFKFEKFYELLGKFNKGGQGNKLLAPLQLSSDEVVDENIIKGLKGKYLKIMFVIFTEYNLPKDCFEPFKKSQVKFQTYCGAVDNFKMSNFTIKCLEKLGGHLSVIANSYENNSTYFVGIDLGHTTNVSEKYSNIGAVFFDNKGCIVTSSVLKLDERNEALTLTGLEYIFKSFFKFIKKSNMVMPARFVIHRDGKLHSDDISFMLKVIESIFSINDIDIVEVIKSGYPIISLVSNNKKYLNPESGSFWKIEAHKYAILVTNTQAEEKNAILSPIIIKHKYGNKTFNEIIEQVYWFTKIYTNNLYNSTRLPATTEKANNVVGTGRLEHKSTFLA